MKKLELKILMTIYIQIFKYQLFVMFVNKKDLD
jgi:hypothetical protein